VNTEVKKSIDQLLSTLKEKLGAPGHSLLSLLTVMGRFAHYSLSNQLLIYGQRPTATKVLGFQAWRKVGYQVRKGEKGIAIYAPMKFRGDHVALELDARDDGIRIGFRVAYVFDVSQVDPIDGLSGEPLPLPAPAASLTCLKQLKTFLFGHNIELAYAALSAGCYGFTDGKRITVASGLAAHAEFATLIHETTHTLLHFGAERPDLTTRETEAEAVAYILCEQFGVPGTELSVDYIKAYRGTPETLATSLERIRRTAQRLADELAAVEATVA